MDLSIFIPTLNRSKYINILLSYYEKFNFKGYLIIVDSSNTKEFNNNKIRIKKSKLKIIHHRLISDEFFAMKIALTLKRTKYALHSGDDDYFLVINLKKIIDFLDKNIDYIGATGKAIVMAYNSKNRKICGSANHEIPYFEHDEILMRFNKLNVISNLPVYSVFRYQVLKKIYDNLLTDKSLNINVRRVFNEYLWKILPIIFGKTAKIQNYYLVRLQSDSKYIRSPLKNLIKKKKVEVKKIYNICINIIYNLLEKKFIQKIAEKKFRTCYLVSLKKLMIYKVYKLIYILKFFVDCAYTNVKFNFKKIHTVLTLDKSFLVKKDMLYLKLILEK
jgi:glycosyltransferase domain-containing protein